MSGSSLNIRNGGAVEIDHVPALPPGDFHDAVLAACRRGPRISSLFGIRDPKSPDRAAGLIAILADDAESRLTVFRCALAGLHSFPSLTADLPQAQAFEREIFEEFGLRPEGHPWLKPLRRHADLESALPGPQPPPHSFFQVAGAGVHEVAVGPVHAGIIEPGHFRFQCAGENVLNLEIQLGYQRRGSESLFLRSSPARQMTLAESVAGDTSIGHSLAYCMVQEALSNQEAPLCAQITRGLALELERLANHVGDLGALCNDVGYLPGSSWFGRLRGEFLNLLMDLSGNRFGRGLLVPGGVRFVPSADQRADMLTRLARADRDLRATAEIMFDSPSVTSRFESAGIVTRETAEELGLVGPVARASGIDRDVRRDYPFGIYRFSYIPVSLLESGDVMARAMTRWLEIQRSLMFVREQFAEFHEQEKSASLPSPRPRMLAVALVEGWRGEIAHAAVTGDDGRLTTYKFVDPSFHNWFGLSMALRGNPISDFPLCNKSFNLSYAGHDL